MLNNTSSDRDCRDTVKSSNVCSAIQLFSRYGYLCRDYPTTLEIGVRNALSSPPKTRRVTRYPIPFPLS